MSAPKNPALGVPAALSINQPALTKVDCAVLKYFHSMDDRSQAFILGLMEMQAADCPRRTRPLLHLVNGGAA